MKLDRGVWRLIVAATTLVGALATLASMPPGRAVATTLTTSAFGAVLGYTVLKDAPALKDVPVRHPVLTGAAVFGWPALVLPGLVVLLGPWALVVTGVLVVVSPCVAGLTTREIHRRTRQHESSDVERAALADEDEALRRQWLSSTALLDAATTVEDRLVVVQARSQILDDLAERCGAGLPDYIWASLDADDARQEPGAGPDR